MYPHNLYLKHKILLSNTNGDIARDHIIHMTIWSYVHPSVPLATVLHPCLHVRRKCNLLSPHFGLDHMTCFAQDKVGRSSEPQLQTSAWFSAFSLVRGFGFRLALKMECKEQSWASTLVKSQTQPDPPTVWGRGTRWCCNEPPCWHRWICNPLGDTLLGRLVRTSPEV